MLLGWYPKHHTIHPDRNMLDYNMYCTNMDGDASYDDTIFWGDGGARSLGELKP